MSDRAASGVGQNGHRKSFGRRAFAVNVAELQKVEPGMPALASDEVFVSFTPTFKLRNAFVQCHQEPSMVTIYWLINVRHASFSLSSGLGTYNVHYS